MKDVRKLPHRTAPSLIPEELVGKKFNCPACGTEVEVPWLEKMLFPQQPIAPIEGSGHWVPISIPLKCSADSCKADFHVNVPLRPNENRWSLYGDEAARYIDSPNGRYSTEPLNFFCITLVGLHKRRHERVRQQIYNLKKTILPSQDPNTWSHHFTEIWSDNSTSNRFHLRSKAAKIAYAKKFAKIIREARPELASFNISSCIVSPRDQKNRKQHIKSQKEDVFSQAILTTQKTFREQHKSVNWVFDNIKDTTTSARTEGWAAECFLGLQYTRLFTWLSAGAAAIEATFVPPGSHFLLEIADFMSYCVARDFEKSILGTRSEFPSSLLGNGFYQGTLGCGDIEHIWSHGLPLRKFYGIEDIDRRV